MTNIFTVFFISSSYGHSTNPQITSSKGLKWSLSCIRIHLSMCIASKWKIWGKDRTSQLISSQLWGENSMHKDNQHPGWQTSLNLGTKLPAERPLAHPNLAHALKPLSRSEPFRKDPWHTPSESLKSIPNWRALWNRQETWCKNKTTTGLGAV